MNVWPLKRPIHIFVSCWRSQALSRGISFGKVSVFAETVTAQSTRYWIPTTEIVSILRTDSTPRREFASKYNIHKFQYISEPSLRPHDPRIISAQVTTQSGPYVSTFDNASEKPLNVEIWPSKTVYTVAAVGSSLSAGDYGVAVVYEFFDSKGNRYQSAADFSDSITIAGNTERINVRIPTLRFGELDYESVYIAIYRTVAGGTIYYRDEVIQNDPTVRFLTVQIGSNSDSLIEDEEVLYQTVELPNIQPPASLTMVDNEDKVFLVPAINRRQIWESKPISAGRPLEFSLGLLIDFPGKGDITGMAIDNGRKVVFKKDSIWYFTGRGRDATGQGQFSEIRHITDEAGAIDPRGVLSTTMGIVFQSRRGIMLLTSDLQLNYIGAPVESFLFSVLGATTTIVDVFERHERQQIWFALGGDTHLVWDYYHNIW